MARHRADQEYAQVGELGKVPLATYGGRIAARLTDLLIVFVPSYFPLTFAAAGSLWVIATAILLEMVIYEAILTASTGATPGKRLARIRIVRCDTGAPAGWRRSLLRAVVIGVTVWVISAVFALSDERTHRGLHDHAAGTVVIAV